VRAARGNQGFGHQQRVPRLLVGRAGLGLEQPQLGFGHCDLPALQSRFCRGEALLDAPVRWGSGRLRRLWKGG
jgi:hypothetical protein